MKTKIMNTYQEIKTEKDARVSQILSDCKVFFAFSNEQFAENKTELQDGEKYVSIGSGGYMPKSKIQNWMKGWEDLKKWEKVKMKNKKEIQDAEILYELRNHECFYVCSIEDVLHIFKGKYTAKRIQAVYNKHRETENQY